MSREASILSDKVMKLPEELTIMIFSKLEDDPKTLIRCFVVCKNWASGVSQTVNLSIRLPCIGENVDSLPCSTLHNHIPSSAISGIMNLFVNLESLKVKLCHCPSPTPKPPCHQHVTKVKAEWGVDESRTYTCIANEVGLLSTMEGALVSLELDQEKFDTIENSSALDLYWTMLYYLPKKLRSLEIMSRKMDESRSQGKVFISYDQLSKFPESISNLRVNKRWLEDPKNVVYWHKNQRRKENSLQERVWLFYQWESLVTKKGQNMNDLNEKKADLMKLLDGLDDDEDNGDGKHRSQSPTVIILESENGR